MYWLTVGTLLGLQLEGGHLHLAPCVPADWNSYKIHYRFRDTLNHITIKRIGEPSGQVARVMLDGNECSDKRTPLSDDHQEHFVEVGLGNG